MTTAEITPTGTFPSAGLASAVTGSAQSARVEEADRDFIRYQVQFPAGAPSSLRVSLELGKEDAGVWAHIPELDVSAEGADVGEAFRNVYVAACEWLSYLRDEQPDLAPDVAEQARYVPLIDAPVFSWFKSFRFAD